MVTLASRYVARTVAIGAVAAGLAVGGVPSSAQSLRASDVTRSVQRVLERLPYYGVFDFVAFDVERGTVTLTGYAYHGSLRHAAEAATRRASGVGDVANRMELLPVSPQDDRIRWATFYSIYTDASLSRYAPGAPGRVSRGAYDSRRFPGMQQPLGLYAIHIVVRGARTTLYGQVESSSDRQIAEARAAEVPGVVSVDNEIIVAGSER